MKSLLLPLLVLIALPAHAHTSVHIECKPNGAFGKALRSGWDSLQSVRSLKLVSQLTGDSSRESYVDIEWQYSSADSWMIRTETDRFTVADHSDLLNPAPGRLPSIRFDAVVFTLTKVDLPFTAGPIPPGVYPAEAVLTLVSTYREKPGDDEKKVSTRQVTFSCEYLAK